MKYRITVCSGSDRRACSVTAVSGRVKGFILSAHLHTETRNTPESLTIVNTETRDTAINTAALHGYVRTHTRHNTRAALHTG